MPFFDVEDRLVTAPMGETPLVDLTAAPVAPYSGPSKDYGIDYGNSPNVSQPSIMGASFRQDNIIGSIMSRKDAGISYEMEDGFNPFDKNKGSKYEARPELFTDVFNSKALEARRSQIDMEDEDRAVMARSGLKGVAASLMWQVFDPTILAPGGGVIKAARGGYSLGKSALSIGAWAAAGTALQEGILQSTQQTRPLEDSAIAIGSSLVLGGLLGGGAASLLSRSEARVADRGFRVLHQVMSGEVPAAGAGGSVAAPLAVLAGRVRAGEAVTTSEIVEAARVAALQARQSSGAVERMARIDDVIELMLKRLESETVRSSSNDLITEAKRAFGSDASRLIDEGGVKVVQSVEDLPARPDGMAHPADVRGVYDGQTAYLVADNVAPGEVKGVLLHEVGVHYGMERMVGADNFRVLLDDITARAQAGEARFADALAAVPKDTPSQHVAEEVLAYLVENAPETGVVQRVITAVKQFVRQAFGGKFSGLSEDDIRALAVSALRKWKPDAGPTEIRYSRGYKFTPDDPGGLKPGEKFFDIHDADGNNVASMYVKINGSNARINDVYRPYGAGKGNSLGLSQVRDILRDFLDSNPEIKTITGDRVTGARAGLDDAAREAEVRVRFSRGGNRNERIASQLDDLVRVLQNVDDPAAFAGAVASRGAAAGAELADRPTLEDLSVAGAGARAYAAATKFLNPNLRANFRAAVSARKSMQELLENTVFQEMHAGNKTLGPSVETMMRQEFRSRVIASAQAADNIYQEARKAGLQMTRRDFDEAVAKAMRREDVGDNEYVSKAAASYRKEMFDHFKVMAQNTLGKDGKSLLPADLEVVGAPSYLTRMPNHERLVADEMGFKETVARYYEGVFRGEYEKHSEATRNRIAALEREIDDLRMSPEDRAKTLADIEARLSDMETANAREIDLLGEINRYRQMAIKAGDRGDKKAQKAAKEEAARLFAQGGDNLKKFLKERGDIRRRQRNVDLNYAGMQEREDRIVQQIADIEERNLRAMTRLIDRGQKAEREFSKLDPAKKAEKIAALRTQFADVAARSEKAADSLAERAKAIAAEEISALQKAMKERQAGGMREALAGTVEVKAAAKSEESRKALAEAIKKNATAERARSERLNAIARRLEEAEALDPEGQAMELKRALSDLAELTSGTSLDRGAKAQRLMDRAKALDPKKLDERIKTIETMRLDIAQEFDDRWARARGGEGVDLENPAAKASFREYAEDVARQIYDHYTGRSEASGTVPDFAVPLATGPLKERTFNIPDRLIEPWLENDISRIAERYGRTMSAQIELTRKFGRADMRDQLIEITQEYRDLRERVGLAKTADEALEIVGQKPGAVDSLMAKLRGEGKDKVTKERILAWLNKDEQGAKQDLEGLRDLILGRYKMEENSGDYAKLASNLLAFNYVRAMGGAVIANLGDIYRSAMVNGLGRFMKDGIAPLMTNLEGFRASVKEAQLAGQVGEKWLHQRLATFAEIGDPYGKGTALQRFMENASRVATKWNGLALFTDFSKSLASVTTQNRLIEAVSGGKEQRWLRWAGIDGFMEGRIKDQLSAHSRDIDGIFVAQTEKWTDAEAVRAYRAAVSKTVDTISVERSVGDVPLFVNTPTGRLIAQFRTFNLAANQRVLLNGMQEDKARFVGSIVALASIGMMVSALRSWRGGEERWNKFKESAANPGFLIGEGLDNSGIFTVPFEIANTIEKLTQPSGFSFNPIKTPMMKAFPGKSQQGESSRFASRDPIGALLGPSAGLPMTLAKALGGDVKAGTQLIPFSTYPGMREAVQALTGDSPYGF